MGDLNQRFPDRIAAGATGGHAYFLTQVAAVKSGAEVRNQDWSLARGRWNVSQGLKTQADYETIRDFLYMARGRFHRFRFKDWKDYRCARADGRLVQVTSTTFQIAKVYGSDPTFEYVRNLKRIVANTQSIWKDAVLLTEGGGAGQYTLNDDTGIVTFGTAPGASVLEVSCDFDVPARFDIDRDDSAIRGRKPDGTLFIEWDNIDIVEDRVE